MKNKIMSFVIAVIVVTTNSYAEDISIAPPPVGADSISAKGGEQTRMGVSFLSYSSDAFELTGLGFVVGGKFKKPSGFIIEPSLGMGLLVGGSPDGNTDFSMLSMDANLMFGQKINVVTLFAGPTLSYQTTYMTIDGGASYDTYIDGTTTMSGLAMGVQLDLETSFGLVTPFYVSRSLAGTSDTSSRTGGVTTESSATIDFTTSQVGLDIYFKTLGTSLSAMVQSSDDGDMIYFAYSWTNKKTRQ